MASGKILEKEIVKAVLDYLHYRGIMAWRNNTGAFMSDNNGRRGFYKFGENGSGDIFAVKDKFYAIECKRPGGIQSESQKIWQQRLTQAGGVYILCYSVDDISKIL